MTNRSFLKSLAIVITCAVLPVLMTGCATTGYQTYKAPKTVAAVPEQPVELSAAEPGTTWVHGVWEWDGTSWVWTPGYWK